MQWPLRRSRSLALIAVLVLSLIYYTTRTYDRNGIKWSRFAYSQYATDSATLCNAVMVFEALDRYGSKADRVLLYPKQWDTTVESAVDRDSQLLNLARKKYKVKLHPIKLLAVTGDGTPGTFDNPQTSWDSSITKLLAFSLTRYKRVLHLDSDITLLQHMDELFLLPDAPIAMPQAYWSDRTFEDGQKPFTSLLILLKPDPLVLTGLINTLKTWLKDGGQSDKYDMDLLNSRFGYASESPATVLPHRPYALLSAEFRRHDHEAYLGDDGAAWNPDKVLAEAKLVHFSDWPLPKPWIMWPMPGLTEMQPDCGGSHEGTCQERKLWKELYDDFRRRRRDICRILSVPAPEWASLKSGNVSAVTGELH